MDRGEEAVLTAGKRETYRRRRWKDLFFLWNIFLRVEIMDIGKLYNYVDEVCANNFW